MVPRAIQVLHFRLLCNSKYFMKTILILRLVLALFYELAALGVRFLLTAFRYGLQGLLRVLFQLNTHINY